MMQNLYFREGETLEEDMKKKVDEVLRLENWRGFVNGKVTGGLAVLDVLGIEKEKRIEVLAEALGLCTNVINLSFPERRRPHISSGHAFAQRQTQRH